MNAYERVMNALNGRPVDRPPVLAVLGAYGGRLTGTPLPDLYRDAERYVAGQRAVQSVFGLDMVLAPFDLSIIAEAFGGETAFFDHQPPNMKRPPAADVNAAIALPWPDPRQTSRLPFVVEATQKLTAIYHGIVPVFAVVPGPVAMPVLLVGMEAWMETLLFDRETADRLLEWSGRFWLLWANTLFEAGADGLIVAEGMAAAEVSTRAIFQDQFLPHIRKCFNGVRGPIVFHHTGGRINPVIDLLRDLPNLAGVAISSKDGLIEARRRLGPGIPLLGNLDNLAFPIQTAEKIRDTASTCLRIGLGCGPFLLCNSGGDIPVQTPPENIHAFREAAQLLGSWKTPRTPKTVWVCCGVLQAEIEDLHGRGFIQGELRFLKSLLHMEPVQLETVLSDELAATGPPTVLVFGDCCPSMLQLSDRPGVSRIKAINCCQMLLGKKRYGALMRRESFMLLPEWAGQWKGIVEKELGLSKEVTREMLGECRREIVYLDTGLMPAPETELRECSAYTGLPWRCESVSLDHLLAMMLAAEANARKAFQEKDAS